MSDIENKLPGLYVHVPFCRGKCPYCDFYSTGIPEDTAAWLDALEQEVRLYREGYERFGTLYIGGGTPSVLSSDCFEQMMNCIYRHFGFAANAEVTLEVNPNDLTAEKLKGYRGAGVNRLSIGVQSFDDRVLRQLGRRHTAAESRQSLGLARRAGFDQISLDLMYVIPQQTRKLWEQTLAEAAVFEPEHISCYQLTFKEGTPFEELKARGRIAPASEAEEEALFMTTSRRLRDQGYIHYEVSSFARDENCLAVHNRNYWRQVPYLGLGPSAHSFSGSERWWNHKSLDGYFEDLRAGRLPVCGREQLSAEAVGMEALMLNFRTREGVPLSALEGLKGLDRTLSRLTASQLIKVINRRVVPTTRGLLVADRLPLMFL